MNSYLRSTPPDQQTPTEQAATLNHYSGVLHQSISGTTHVCELCRPAQVREFFAWFATLPTKGELMEPFVEDVQQREHDLQITKDEWAAYNLEQQSKDDEKWERKYDFSKLTTMLNKLRENGEWRAGA